MYFEIKWSRRRGITAGGKGWVMKRGIILSGYNEDWKGRETTGKNGKKGTRVVELEHRGQSHGNEWGSSGLFENLTWLTANEAAEYLRLPSVGALRVLVCRRGIPFHKLGRRLRFKKVDLDRVLETSRNGGF